MKLVYSICLSLFLIFSSSQKDYAQSLSQNDTTSSHNLEVFSSVYRKVISTYPGPIEPNQFMLLVINQMLESIDPFTVFLTEKDVREFKISTSGKFGGVGMLIGNSAEGIFVKEIFTERPAARAGLLPADLIKEVDGTYTKGLSVDEVRSLLMGTPGTSISIGVTRPGETKNMLFNFKRELISLSPVPYYGMLNDNIAYICLTRESEDCSKEVKSALKELYDRHHFKGLVFDIRGNEGGYLKEAVKVANLFIDKGALIASARNKDKDTTYFANDEADYPAISLILLTDNNTASAGEIIAGAMQDNDRGVILGQNTFGKGLVQSVFDMPGGTQLKLTTAHYYTPSGRCIQAFKYDQGTEILTTDSLRKEFKTRNGRKVYSNGGINPDISTDYEESPVIVQTLLNDLLIFDFATKYKIAHPSISLPLKFNLSDEDYIAFTDFVKSRKFNCLTETEIKLAAVKEKAMKEEYWQGIQNEFIRLENIIIRNKEEDFSKYKTSIKKALEVEIVYRYYYQEGRFALYLRDDKEVKKALEILSDSMTYYRLLQPKE